MNMKADLSKTMLNKQQQDAIQCFCDSLTSSSEYCTQSITLYGSSVRTDFRPASSDINLLIILNHADIKRLRALIETVTMGRTTGIAPLFLTEEDLLNFARVFPLKYLSIRESHITLYGKDFPTDIEIGRESLQLRSQQEMLNLLMRLRRYYLNSLGHNLAGLLISSVKGFLEMLRICLYLKNNKLPARDETIDIAAKSFNEDTSVIREILRIKESQEIPDDKVIQEIYEQYFSLVENIMAKI